jgi:hypothetical protein
MLKSCTQSHCSRAMAVFIAVVVPAVRTNAGAPGEAFGSAPTLVHAGTEAMAPGDDGFIKRWTILEPIPSSGLTDSAVKAAVAKEYFADQATMIPNNGDRVTIAGREHTWHAVETTSYNINLFHLARAVDKPTSNVLFWGVAVLDCPEELAGVRLAIGSNAASVWWVNGQEVVGIYGDRQCVIDDGVSKRLTLKKGINIVRCAVINAGGATDFCARFLDGADEPLTAFKISAGDDNP